jgi:hypothetical protein
VEVENLEQLRQALDAHADLVMLDNFELAIGCAARSRSIARMHGRHCWNAPAASRSSASPPSLPPAWTSSRSAR